MNIIKWKQLDSIVDHQQAVRLITYKNGGAITVESRERIAARLLDLEAGKVVQLQYNIYIQKEII